MQRGIRGAIMSQPFGPVYADTYDLLYHDKDYGAECNVIESIFRPYDNTIRSVLDLGCGTGNHAFPLAQRGYEVVGVDRSTDMLAHARRKLVNAENDGRLVFQQGDIRAVNLKRNFDAVLMMFAVLGYQLDNTEVLSALKTARRHLRSGGIFIFDVWYGPAVLHQRPSERVKVIPSPEGQILRVASGELDVRRHLCTVHFRVWRLAGGRLVAETEESHPMRYFFPLELNLFLEFSGFTPIRLGAFPEFDKDPDETSWNVLGLARAV
jgi:SAM-dependent methyltransferase